jgi:hypothetical protein
MFSMKSSRLRIIEPSVGRVKHLAPALLLAFANQEETSKFSTSKMAANLAQMAAPVPVQQVQPDQVIEDILIATLKRVQNSANPELAAAALRYITLLKEKAV